MMMKKKKTLDNLNVKNSRFLITVNVLGSSGPLRFVVNDDDRVYQVIDSTLKMYARGGRLPVFGSNRDNFLLYPSNAGSEAMKANEVVGSCGERTFVLCKEQSHPQMTQYQSEMKTGHRRSRGWKAWFKFISH